MKDITGREVELGDIILEPTTCAGLVFTIVTTENKIHEANDYICLIIKKYHGETLIDADVSVVGTDVIVTPYINITGHGEFECDIEERRRMC